MRLSILYSRLKLHWEACVQQWLLKAVDIRLLVGEINRQKQLVFTLFLHSQIKVQNFCVLWSRHVSSQTFYVIQFTAAAYLTFQIATFVLINDDDASFMYFWVSNLCEWQGFMHKSVAFKKMWFSIHLSHSPYSPLTIYSAN